MKHLVIPAIVCIFFIAGACKKGLPPPPIYLAVHKNTVTLKGVADSKDTIFVATNDQWVATIEQGASWLTVTPAADGNGETKMIINSSSNNTGAARRTATIEIRTVNGFESRIITVVQLQLNETLLNVAFGGEGYDTFDDITFTPEGGYIAVGQSGSTKGDGTGGKGGQDIWVVKFNEKGEKLWHKKFGGSQEDIANSIVRTAANNYIILGSTLSTDGDVTNNKGSRDAWLVGIDGNGNLQWQKTLGGSSDEWLYNLKPVGDGNFLMAGLTYSADGDVAQNAGDADAWIVKVSDQGNIVWEETYGGTKQDLAYDATPVSDGGYIFCGRLVSMDGDASDREAEVFAAWLVKLNPSRAIAGKVYLGGSGYDYGTVALEALNGDYVFAGETNSPGAFDNFHANRDAFVCRLDATGNVKWAKAYGGSERDEPGDLIETNDGDFIFGGLTMSANGDIARNAGGEDGWLMRLDGDGNIVNSTTIGGTANDNIKKVKELPESHFAFVGLTGSYEDGYPEFADVMHGWFQVINLP